MSPSWKRATSAAAAPARNTAIIRSNYLTPEGVAFYEESAWICPRPVAGVRLQPLLFGARPLHAGPHRRRGADSRWRAEVNKHLGVDSELVCPDEIQRICPQLNMSDDVRYPILGALYHPPGAIARHDAVAWGYARGADRARRRDPSATESPASSARTARWGVETTRGNVNAGASCRRSPARPRVVAKMAGLQTADPHHSAAGLRVAAAQAVPGSDHRVGQPARLHLAILARRAGHGRLDDPYELYSTRSTLDFKEGLIGHMLELFPFLAEVKVMRQWAGMADMTPDFWPVMGLTPVENYFIDAGWGTWGFKATPVCGKRMARRIATASRRADRALRLTGSTIHAGRREGRGLGRAIEETR